MKSRLHDRAARFTAALYLLVPLGLLAPAFWKLPGLARAAGAILATVAIFAFMQALLISPERARQWQDAVVIIGHVTSIVVPLGVFVAGTGAIWSWYPFQPILDVPFAQLTAGAVLVDLFGVTLFATLPAWFGGAFHKSFRADLYTAGQFGLGLVMFVAAVLIIHRQMS